MNLFDDSDEPALKQLTRKQLVEAYAQELNAHPPVASCAGDDDRAMQNCRRFAERDLARVFVAAARLGATLQLVALSAGQESGKK